MCVAKVEGFFRGAKFGEGCDSKCAEPKEPPPSNSYTIKSKKQVAPPPKIMDE